MLKKLLHAAAALVLTSGLALAAFNLGFDGKFMPVGTGTPPALSACGTSSVATGSSDTAGAFTVGQAGCVLTFNVPYVTAPSCVVTELTINTAARTTAISNTAITIAAGGAASTYTYICAAKAGG